MKSSTFLSPKKWTIPFLELTGASSVGLDTQASSTLVLGNLIFNLRGPKSLCKQHYDVYKKKNLKVGKILDKNPSAPYDIDQNSELEYLNKQDSKLKGDIGNGTEKKFNTLANLRPSKKFK